LVIIQKPPEDIRMDAEETRRVESSQRQHHEVLEHQDRAYLACQSIEYNLFAMLKPALSKDGDQWCVLFGEDLMTGIAGFGDTPHEAILVWNRKWHEKIYRPA
jgi:hypothetical protein